MTKNKMVAANSKYNDITTILRGENTKQELQCFIDETVRCKMKIMQEQDAIRAIREAAVEKLGIEPKMFNTLVGLFFNNNFMEKKEEINRLDSAIDALLGDMPE